MSLRTAALALANGLKSGMPTMTRSYATKAAVVHPPRRTYLHKQYESLVKDNRVLFVFQHNNLTVKEFTQLRQELSLIDGPSKLTVVRSSVFGSVLRETKFSNLQPLVSGPTCVLSTNASEKEYPELLKQVIQTLGKNKKLVLLGGKLDNSLLNQADVTQVVQLPGLDMVRAELLGTIEQPARQILGVLESPAKQLHSVLDRRV